MKAAEPLKVFLLVQPSGPYKVGPRPRTEACESLSEVPLLGNLCGVASEGLQESPHWQEGALGSDRRARGSLSEDCRCLLI